MDLRQQTETEQRVWTLLSYFSLVVRKPFKYTHIAVSFTTCIFASVKCVLNSPKVRIIKINANK